jgi:hypothetical protein
VDPYYYAGWLGLILGVRVRDAVSRRLARRRQALGQPARASS